MNHAQPLTGTAMKRVRYAVDGLLPLGRLTLVIGRPGSTKTLALVDIGAQITRGAVMGDLHGQRHGVLYLTMENSREEAIKPRVTAAQGVASRFCVYEGNLDLPEQVDQLRRMINESKAKLVVLDTITDYLTLNITNSQQNTKRSLQPLADLAEELDVALVAVFWANKAGKGLSAVAGSVATSGTARNVIVVGQLDQLHYVIGTIKTNDGPDHYGYVYARGLTVVGEEEIPAPKLEWLRRAKPAEIDLAFEQLQAAEDPAIVDLLTYMAAERNEWTTEPPPSTTAGWFGSEDLISVMKQTTMRGGTVARKVVAQAFNARLIERWSGGQGKDYTVAWRITDLGATWLAHDEADSIHGLFHTDKRKTTRKTQPRARRSAALPKTTTKTKRR